VTRPRASKERLTCGARNPVQHEHPASAVERSESRLASRARHAGYISQHNSKESTACRNSNELPPRLERDPAATRTSSRRDSNELPPRLERDPAATLTNTRRDPNENPPRLRRQPTATPKLVCCGLTNPRWLAHSFSGRAPFIGSEYRCNRFGAHSPQTTPIPTIPPLVIWDCPWRN
jgi:hypothetical protein